MARTAATRSGFDKNLISKVLSLFEGAAKLSDGRGNLLFPRGANHHYTPGRVRQCFNIDDNLWSIWRYQSWNERGYNWEKAKEVFDHLIAVFEGNADSDQHLKVEAGRIKQVREYWSSQRADDLRFVIDRLTYWRQEISAGRYPGTLEEVLQMNIQGPAEFEVSSSSKPTSVGMPAMPADLRPPALQENLMRPDLCRKIGQLRQKHLSIVLCAPIINEASNAVREAVAPDLKASSSQLVWFHLTRQSTPRQILDRLVDLRPLPPIGGSDLFREIVGWLEFYDAVLVIDGITYDHFDAFWPMIEFSARLTGPCRIMFTACLDIDVVGSLNIPPMTVNEIASFLKRRGIKADQRDLSLELANLDIWPGLLLKIIGDSKSIDGREILKKKNNYDLQSVSNIDEIYKDIAIAISFIGPDFDEDLISDYISHYHPDVSISEYFQELQSRFILKRLPSGRWLGLSYEQGAEVGPLMERQRYELSDYGVRYYWRRLTCAGTVRFDIKNDEDADLARKLLRLIDIRNIGDGRRKKVADMLSRFLEHHAALPYLQSFLRYELSQPDCTDWTRLRYSRSLMYSGDIKGSLEILDEVFHRLVDVEEARDGDLYLATIRQFCELLTEIGHPSAALSILDSAVSDADTSSMTYVVAVQTVSALAWALVKAGYAEQALLISDEVLERRFGGLNAPFTRAVAQVRRGVCLREMGDWGGSMEALSNAADFFKGENKRAYLWALANLTISQCDSGEKEAAYLTIQQVAGQAYENGVMSSDIAEAYERCMKMGILEGVSERVESELARAREYSENKVKIRQEIVEGKLIDHIRLDFHVVDGREYEFDIEKIEIFSLQHPYAIKEKFSQSLIKNLSRHDLEENLDEIFLNNDKEKIFFIHIYNRLIVNACKKSRILEKKYIYPYIDIIKNMIDGVLYLYARYFESRGDIENAELLLENVRNKENFNYLNILANCRGHNSLEQALHINDKALGILPDFRRQQRAQILNNKATLVYKFRCKDKYPTAIQWCEEAISLARKPRFFWPRNMLLVLQLEQCAYVEVIKILSSHHSRFHVPTNRLIKIIEQVRDGRKRAVAVEWIEAQS